MKLFSSPATSPKANPTSVQDPTRLKRFLGKRTIQRIQNNDPSLTDLNLRYRSLTDPDVQVLMDLLRENKTITDLDVSLNEIGVEGAKALAANTAITNLDVCNNRIGAEGAKALADNTTITTLQLRHNEIGDEGAKALAANKTITNLDVSWNEIGVEGAKTFAENKTITTLDVDKNHIGDEGAIALLKNKSVRFVFAVGNNISYAIESRLESSIEHNSTVYFSLFQVAVVFKQIANSLDHVSSGCLATHMLFEIMSHLLGSDDLTYEMKKIILKANDACNRVYRARERNQENPAKIASTSAGELTTYNRFYSGI